MELTNIKDVSIFAEHVGTRFRIQIDADEFITAKLVEAEALPSGRTRVDSTTREPFSLLFEVVGGVDLPQQTYQVRHEALGVLPLFLVPVGTGVLESVFN